MGCEQPGVEDIDPQYPPVVSQTRGAPVMDTAMDGSTILTDVFTIQTDPLSTKLIVGFN